MRFMDMMRDDMHIVGVRDEDAENGEMEDDELLWQYLEKMR